MVLLPLREEGRSGIGEPRGRARVAAPVQALAGIVQEGDLKQIRLVVRPAVLRVAPGNMLACRGASQGGEPGDATKLAQTVDMGLRNHAAIAQYGQTSESAFRQNSLD